MRTPALAGPRCSMRRRPAGLCAGCIVGPLARDAIDALLAARFRTAIPPPRVSEIADMSGGNPLFAIEIGRSIERGEIVHQPGRPLKVPATLARSRRSSAQPARASRSRRRCSLRPPYRTRRSSCSTRSSRTVTFVRPWSAQPTPAWSSCGTGRSPSAIPCSLRPSTTPSGRTVGEPCTADSRRRSEERRSAPGSCHSPPKVPTRRSPLRSTKLQRPRPSAERQASPPTSRNRRRR